MATFETEHPIKKLRGNIGRTTHRQKVYRDANGKIVAEAKPEAYAVKNPRDYKKKPAKGAELQNINFFREASLYATDVISAANPNNHPTQEQLDRYNDFSTRFQAQLTGPADHEAPVDPKTKSHKHYKILYNFICALRLQQLKSAQGV